MTEPCSRCARASRKSGSAPARLSGTGNNGSTFHQRSTNYALFTHNSFDIIEDALTLTVGARYTHEKKTLSGDANFTNTLCPAIVNSPFQALASLACVINGTAPDIVAGAPGTKFSEGQWTGTAVLKPETGARIARLRLGVEGL